MVMTGERFVFKFSCWIFFCLGINTLSIDLSMKSNYQGVGDLHVSDFLAFCYADWSVQKRTTA